MVLTLWLDSLIEWAKFLGSGWYSSIKQVVIQVLTIVIVFSAMFWLAVFMYGSFYYTYMPSAVHTKDVHLQFRSDCEEAMVHLCSFPSANISLTRDSSKPMLKRGQPYVMTLELNMPESNANYEIGMFMVQIEVYSRHGVTVTSSRRSSIIHFKSELLKTLETWVLLGTYLLGRIFQKQRILVTLYEDFEEDPYKPSMGAVIQVESKRIQIYDSKLIIHAKFYGLRYLMYYYPIICAGIGVTINMFFLLILTILSWYKFAPEALTSDNRAPNSYITWEDRKKQNRPRITERKAGSPSKSLMTEAIDADSGYSELTASPQRSSQDIVTLGAGPDDEESVTLLQRRRDVGELRRRITTDDDPK